MFYCGLKKLTGKLDEAAAHEAKAAQLGVIQRSGTSTRQRHTSNRGSPPAGWFAA